MENIGALSLILAFCLSLYALAGSALGQLRNKPFLILSARRAVYAMWALTTLAAVVLVNALLTSDFRLAYVALHTSSTLPTIFKFTAWWGGMEGSLLLWAWLLSCYAAAVVFLNRRKSNALMPWVTATIMATQAFFLYLICFPMSPFELLAVGKEVVGVPDGNGLNPSLQYWAMAIHPPTLYMGYVGFIVPFAFAAASLITRAPGDAWIHTTRRWTLFAWMFQGAGILLGALWAYAALGWGGYWAWDPVENAALLPWITGTAFLHSVMMQEKKGMMKVWNVSLISATFFLCILGTFLTRSGVVSSVHSFAQSPISHHFIYFLIAHVAVITWLILSRLDYLRSEAELESVLSRESSFLFNNLILLASCFSILWGTLFPVITEAINGEKISVSGPFFNAVNIPIGLFLMLLTGVGPLIAWRRSSLASLEKAFMKPILMAAATIALLVALGIRHPYALISFFLCGFVLYSILIEFWKGASAVASKTGQNLAMAMVELTHRNTRRYGGYIVHIAMVMLFVGFTGQAFNKEATVEVGEGQKWTLGGYELEVASIGEYENEHYGAVYSTINVYQGGEKVGELKPERRIYKTANEDQHSIVAIRRRLNEDLYLTFAGLRDGKAIVQSYVFPLIAWLIIGCATLFFGTLICLVPSKVRLQYAKTKVVGAVEGAKVVK